MENSLILEKVLNRNDKYRKTSVYLQKDLEDIIKEISEELKIDAKDVRFAIIAQFRFVRDVIKQCKKPNNEGFDVNAYKSLRIPFLGRFEPKGTFLKKYGDANRKSL